jgi:hypothetical protein
MPHLIRPNGTISQRCRLAEEEAKSGNQLHRNTGSTAEATITHQLMVVQKVVRGTVEEGVGPHGR